jgi:hypothetical protein
MPRKRYLAIGIGSDVWRWHSSRQSTQEHPRPFIRYPINRQGPVTIPTWLHGIGTGPFQVPTDLTKSYAFIGPQVTVEQLPQSFRIPTHRTVRGAGEVPSSDCQYSTGHSYVFASSSVMLPKKMLFLMVRSS